MMFPFVHGIYGSAGARYYVDATGGNDANDGRSIDAAWQTLAKVSGFSFGAGDSVLLKRGETWNETLTPPTDGITIADYGVGALPIIHGQDTRLYCIDARGRTGLKIENLVVQDPTAAGIIFGGGIHVVNGVTADGSGDQNFQHVGDAIGAPNVTYNDCTTSNAVDDGFSLHLGQITVNNSTITGCGEGFQDGGTTVTTATFNNCLFDTNTKDINNNGLYVALTVNRCLFRGMAGGGHQSITGRGTLNYCIFDMADSGLQTEVAAAGAGAVLDLNNCTFYGWNGSSDRGGLNAGNGATLNATNCIFDRIWRIIKGATGTANLNYCNAHSVATVTVTTNTNATTTDPLLTNPAADDFTLSAGSPAIGTGTTYAGQLATDYAGNPVASPPSLGALEYVP